VHTADTTFDRIARWAGGHDNVRSLIVTSTRVIPGAYVDAYSDYDVVAIVDDVRSMFEDRKWQDYFGEVLISYWDPVEANPSTGAEWVGNVTNYANGLKIDFSLWSLQHFADVTAGPDPYAEFDAGYRVVVDKDGLTTELPAPTFGSYIPARPNEATYLRLITDFLIGVPNVAKSLLRGELLPAKWVLDFDMRFNYLVPLLEWRAECDHDWSLKTGNLGKGLEAHLPAESWRELERTFTGADPNANWEALFEMIALFDRVAREVADLLGYTHPEDLIHRVTDHTQRMRDGVFAGGPLDAE
jgi:aminoglycoside 6-adenylyltransferase